MNKSTLTPLLITSHFLIFPFVSQAQNPITFDCKDRTVHTCMKEVFDEGNLSCQTKDGKTQGSVDLLELANQYTADNVKTIHYTKEKEVEKQWVDAKVQQMKACIALANLGADKKTDSFVDNSVLLIKKMSTTNTEIQQACQFEQTPKQYVETLSKIHDENAASSTVASLSNTISACESALKVAINTNEEGRQTEIKSTLRSIKTVIESSTDVAISGLLNTADAGFTPESIFALNGEMNSITKRIDGLLGLSGADYLIPSWRDTALSYQFYSGIEYNNVDDIFDGSGLRIGLLAYLRMGKGIERIRSYTEGECHVNKLCGDWFPTSVPHIYGNFALTGQGESAGEDNNQFEALEFETGVYWPIYMGSRGSKDAKTYQELSMGVIAIGGGRTTETDNFDDRYYAGLRFANNEETYFDILYGKTESLTGNRLELRGQLPVSKVGTGRLFIGGAANLQLSRSRGDDGEKIDEPDAYKIFITWQTTFDSIWKAFSRNEDE